MTDPRQRRFSPEVRQRAVRLVQQRQGDHASQWAAISSVAAKIGCTGETLRGWLRQSERGSGKRAGTTSDDRDRIKALERENRELSQANEILRKAGAYLLRRSSTAGSYRRSPGCHGVEPICGVLPIAPSTYHVDAARQVDPARRPARARRDAALMPFIERVFDENFSVYGVRKVWRRLLREGHQVARCTVAQLMKTLGLQGVIRGKPVQTTISDRAAPSPLDHLNRQFMAPRPNALWVSDFTYVSTGTGLVYVAFVIDTDTRRIAGWRVSRTAHTGFVLDALEQALYSLHRAPGRSGHRALGRQRRRQL